MTKRPTTQIELGDFVTIVKGDNEGWTGVLDNEFVVDGVVTFAVVDDSDPDTFYYANEIKLHKKGALDPRDFAGYSRAK